MPRKPKEDKIVEIDGVAEITEGKVEENIGLGTEETFDEEGDEEEFEDFELG